MKVHSLSKDAFSFCRRVQDDVLDATVDHGKVKRSKDIRKMDLNESGDVSVKHDCHESAAENLESRDTGRRGKRKENGVANRYGMNDSEVEAITDDESVCPLQILFYLKTKAQKVFFSYQRR